MEIRRGVLNRVKLSMVCNASATNFRVPPDFPGTFGYPNVRTYNYIRFRTPQGVVRPPRIFVLGGFSVQESMRSCANEITFVVYLCY